MSNTPNNKSSFSMHIGSSSILLIFIILALIAFACLTLSSTLADKTLNDQVFERTIAYYEAYSEAEKTLASIDATLIDIYAQTDDAEDYFALAGNSKTFAITITSQQILEVVIQINYPEHPEDSFYDVTSWTVSVIDDLQLDDSLPVFGQ